MSLFKKKKKINFLFQRVIHVVHLCIKELESHNADLNCCCMNKKIWEIILNPFKLEAYVWKTAEKMWNHL